MLSLPMDTLEWIVQRAREFDGKDIDTLEESGETDGSDPLSVLEARPDDTAEGELRSWIADLDERQQAELVAIFWIGRGDGEPSDLPELIAEAARARSTPTEDYLLGSPMLGDHLEAGIEKVGVAELAD
ncbi:MAG: DUF3775 domain-containing protein [Pseudomonadota bacterium]